MRARKKPWLFNNLGQGEPKSHCTLAEEGAWYSSKVLKCIILRARLLAAFLGEGEGGGQIEILQFPDLSSRPHFVKLWPSWIQNFYQSDVSNLKHLGSTSLVHELSCFQYQISIKYQIIKYQNNYQISKISNK